jgi:hypothetical protein
VTGLTLFNDVITGGLLAPDVTHRPAADRQRAGGLRQPDRALGRGGEKIARAIVQSVAGNTIFPRSQVFAE